MGDIIEVEETKNGHFEVKKENEIREYSGPRKVGQSTAIAKRDKKELAKKTGKKIVGGIQTYNRIINDLPKIRKVYDPDVALGNLWNMDATKGLFGGFGEKKKKDE